MTLLSRSAVDDCVVAVTATFAGVFAHIEQWRVRIIELVETQTESSRPRMDDLVEHLVLAEL